MAKLDFGTWTLPSPFIGLDSISGISTGFLWGAKYMDNLKHDLSDAVGLRAFVQQQDDRTLVWDHEAGLFINTSAIGKREYYSGSVMVSKYINETEKNEENEDLETNWKVLDEFSVFFYISHFGEFSFEIESSEIQNYEMFESAEIRVSDPSVGKFIVSAEATWSGFSEEVCLGKSLTLSGLHASDRSDLSGLLSSQHSTLRELWYHRGNPRTPEILDLLLLDVEGNLRNSFSEESNVVLILIKVPNECTGFLTINVFLNS